eukprot:6875887-Pyramimonas_sp.AAC.1
MAGKLARCMYSVRHAAQGWERFYTRVLTQAGFIQGRSSPCIFYEPTADVRFVVHGDDVIAFSDDGGLEWLTK